MRYIIILILMVFIILPSSDAYAGGETYQNCKTSLKGKFSAKELEKGCSCSQKRVSQMGSRKLSKSQSERIVANCFSGILRSEVKNVFYKRCMDNPKQSGNPSYKEYCACSADIYVRNVFSSNGEIKTDKNAAKKASKKAVRICLAKSKKNKK